MMAPFDTATGSATALSRDLVRIDQEKCDGCGLCIDACAEAAIEMIGGKAVLVSDVYCDGLGACLGHCPQDAITVEKMAAKPFDERAVEQRLAELARDSESGVVGDAVSSPRPAATARPSLPVHSHAGGGGGGGCPGSRTVDFSGEEEAGEGDISGKRPSELRQWPVQLHLVSPMAPYFEGADLVLAADCVPASYGDFHKDFLKGRALAIACPKLDSQQDVYIQKLVHMIDHAKLNTINIMVMEVPCCSGLVYMAKEAVNRAERKVPIKQTVVGVRGDVLDESWV